MPSLFADDAGQIKILVDRLGYDLEPSILIGGWATWFRVRGEISHDIDFIVGPENRHKLQELVTDLSENSALQGRKMRGTIDGVHLDIYLPYESQLGAKLRLRVEILGEYTEPELKGGWRLLTLEAQLISKLAALIDRPNTVKGRKDAGEVLTLLKESPDVDLAVKVLVRASTLRTSEIPEVVAHAFEVLFDVLTLTKADRALLVRQRRLWEAAAARAARGLGTWAVSSAIRNSPCSDAATVSRPG